MSTLALLSLTTSAAAQSDHAVQAYDIVPPGQSGSLTPGVHSTDQIEMYDSLAPLGDRVTDSDLSKYFKPFVFGTRDMSGAEVATGRPGLRIVRDEYAVPHIFGNSRADLMFGVGWVTAEDRGAIIEVLRGAGRLSSLDVPGFSVYQNLTDGLSFEPSKATENRLGEQLTLLRKQPGGKAIYSDVTSYVAGINAYNHANSVAVKDWTPTDVTAAAAVIAATFGNGGGKEAQIADLRSRLINRNGEKLGSRVWDDLANPQDPDSQTTLAARFPYRVLPRGATPGSSGVDANTLDRLALVNSAAQKAQQREMSNAIVVSGKLTKSGHPMAVMGPQAGYYYPEILLEMDLHGGGIDARGVAFAGASMYVSIGRTASYTWSATTSDADNTDEFLEELCSPGGEKVDRRSRHYIFNGRCRAMNEFSAGTVEVSGERKSVRFWETVHGPITGTVLVHGRPFAIARSRSTRNRELLGTSRTLAALNTSAVHSGSEFVSTALKAEMSLNWLYADSRDIAFASSGRLPKPARGTDPRLPTLGNGRYEWRGFLNSAQHPNGVNPASGFLTNWNSRPATDFGSPDFSMRYSSVQRVQLINDVRSGSTLGDVVGIANRAATQDLRDLHAWPTVARVLNRGAAPSSRASAAAKLASDWAENGASRLDRDLDGKIDDPGAAVIDRAWPGITEAVMGSRLGSIQKHLSEMYSSDEVPTSEGSAFEAGWYGFIVKDLRALLGSRQRSSYSVRYCGDGDLKLCRKKLWRALEETAKTLTKEQGTDPSKWRSSATRERITFTPGILSETMRWVNRPTFQEVVEFG